MMCLSCVRVCAHEDSLVSCCPVPSCFELPVRAHASWLMPHRSERLISNRCYYRTRLLSVHAQHIITSQQSISHVHVYIHEGVTLISERV